MIKHDNNTAKVLLVILYFTSVPETTLIHQRQKLQRLKFNHNIKLDPYVMDVKGFYPYIHELVNNVFKFRSDHVKTAKEIYNKMNPNQHTMVSIHVRLTDIEKHIKHFWNVDYTPDDYFAEAMDYFNRKYEVIDWFIKYLISH